MPKKRIFLDTMVCYDIASPNLNLKEEWFSILRYVLQDYKYVISPLTFLEILIRIGRGDSGHFEQNRRSLQFLVGTKKRKTYLEFPGHFLLKHLGVNSPPPELGPRNFEQWARVVIKARDKNALEQGSVKIDHTRKRYRLDFPLVDKQLQTGKDEHRQTLEGVRDGSKIYTPSLLWAVGLLKGLSIEPDRNTCEKVSTELEAAYCFEEYLWKQAKNLQYNFEKHDSDWIDRQQLFYLCDENIWFVTNDKNLLQESKKSSQRDRVVPFKRLRELLAAKCKLA